MSLPEASQVQNGLKDIKHLQPRPGEKERTEYTFVPHIRKVGSVLPTYTIADLDRETGVYSASPDYVRRNCGPIANDILTTIPEEFFAEADRLGLYPNLDVRIHRLYPGDIPAYPGWHADGEHRENYFSQPRLDIVPRHRHIVTTVSTDPEGVSNTLFVAEPFTAVVVDPNAENTLWGQVHQQIEEQQPQIESANDGDIMEFDSFTLHKATPARTRGWRLFLRASMWHKDYLTEEGGKISKQEQVYKVNEGSGW